jgi:hypothetical protein
MFKVKMKFLVCFVITLLLTGCFKEQGKLEIDGSQREAEVFVDGDKVAMTGSNRKVNINLDAGEHSITLKKLSDDGELFYIGSKSVFVGENTTNNVYISMQSSETDKRKKRVELDRKNDINELLKYQNSITQLISKDILGIKIGDSASKVLKKSQQIGTHSSYSDKYNDEYGYGSIVRDYTFWGNGYSGDSIKFDFYNCILTRIRLEQRLPGSKNGAQDFIAKKMPVANSRKYTDKHSVQIFDERSTYQYGTYSWLGFHDSYIQKLRKKKRKYTCSELGR